MRRRAFVALALGTWATWPSAAQGERMRRIAVLMGLMEDAEGRLRASAFRAELERLGWREGHTVQIDYRWAGGEPAAARRFARELIELRPDVLVSNTTPALGALRHETQEIPIVFVSAADPVGSAVTTLARPSGNVTGFTNFEPSLAGKWLELLKEIAPWVTRLSVMYNPDTAPDRGDYYFVPLQNAAPAFGVEVIATLVHDRSGIEQVMLALARDASSGVFGMPDAFMTVHRDLVIALAARHRIPAIYPFRYYATDGGLVSYGINVVDLFVRAASYVDRILKGTKPGDLPVQQPTKFELVINLKTARALGLTLAPSLLARADEVIE
jgi:putative tryptophan/tyrosine transport system substrate-binding protein